jgi:hypothetical protein
MVGLLLFAVVGAWFLFSLWLAAQIPRISTSPLLEMPYRVVAFTGLCVSPVIDDLLGTWQYKHYCSNANEVRILGTVAVSEQTGLFSSDGEWLLDRLQPSDWKERHRLGRVADSLVRWDHGTTQPATRLWPIGERTTRIYDRSSDRLVMEFKSYHYRGGILRRNLLDSASQCFPTEFGSAMYKKVFSLQKS